MKSKCRDRAQISGCWDWVWKEGRLYWGSEEIDCVDGYAIKPDSVSRSYRMKVTPRQTKQRLS